MTSTTNLSILLLSFYLPPPVRGGSGVFLRELFSRFPRGEVDALVGVFDQDAGVTHDGGMTIIRKKSLSWKWYAFGHIGRFIRIGHFIFFLMWLWQAFLLCQRKKYDLIICGEYFPAGLVAFGLNRVKKIPYGIFYHGEELYGMWGWRKKLNKFIMSTARMLIANSINTKNLLVAEGGRSNDIIVCRPCVDHTRFVPAPDAKHAKIELGLNDKKVVLTVARLMPRKGHKRAITALKRIGDKHGNVVLVIVGRDFGYRDKILQHISACGLEDKVVMKGNVGDEDLIKYYQACDVFVMVSDTGINNNDVEGFGITFLEASACGKPVIGGNTGGMPEAIQDNVTGFIVDAQDDEKFAYHLGDLLENPDHASEIGRNGRNRAILMFDYDQRSAYLRKMLVDLVSSRVAHANTVSE